MHKWIISGKVKGNGERERKRAREGKRNERAWKSRKFASTGFTASIMELKRGGRAINFRTNLASSHTYVRVLEKKKNASIFRPLASFSNSKIVIYKITRI